MWQFGIILLNICLLKQGPQDIPYSKPLLIMLCAIFALFIVTIISRAFPLETAVTLATVTLAVTWLFLYLILQHLKLSNRLIQMMSAIIGVELAFIGSVAILKIATFFPSTALLSILITLTMVWKLMIYSNIFRHGFMIGNLSAALLAIAYNIMHGIAAQFLTGIVI